MAKDRHSVRKINALKARQTLGTLLEEVFYRDEHFIIERAGKPMAALVPLSLLEEVQKKSTPAKPGRDTGKGTKR
jgi:hypothetical protein